MSELTDAYQKLYADYPELAEPIADMREQSLDEMIERGEQFEPVSWEDIELIACAEEDKAHLNFLISQLDEPDRTILMLHCAGRMTQAEIGERVNRRQNFIHRRIMKFINDCKI